MRLPTKETEVYNEILSTGQANITTTAQSIPANSKRTKIVFHNISNEDIYVGKNNTVTISSGFPIPAGSEKAFLITATVATWLIHGGVGNKVISWIEY